MILVIAEPGDAAALWLARALAGRLTSSVRFVTSAQLVYSPRIAHRFGRGAGRFSFVLADGETLTGEGLSGVINRFVAIPTAHLAAAHPEDRAYAESELHAFLLGWLGSLACPMLNAPSPECLAGPHFGELQALHFAALAGLGVPPARLGTSVPGAIPFEASPAMRHFVLDGRLIGPILPAAERDAMLQFARLWGARLVQIESGEAQDGRRFHGATGLVDFPSGGRALLRAIAAVFGR